MTPENSVDLPELSDGQRRLLRKMKIGPSYRLHQLGGRRSTNHTHVMSALVKKGFVRRHLVAGTSLFLYERIK